MRNILLILFLVVWSQVYSQVPRKSYTNVGLQYIQPLDSTKDFQEGAFWGVNAGTELPIFGSPIEIGFDYSWGSFDSKEREFVESYYVSISGQYIYNYATMRFRNTNNRAVSNVRLKLFNGPFQPYFEFVGGFESYRVATDIVSSYSGYSASNGGSFQYFDIAYLYGWSGGLRVSSNEKLFIDFKVQKIKSGPVNYIDLDSITIIDGQTVNFVITEIKPEKFVYQVGFSYTY